LVEWNVGISINGGDNRCLSSPREFLNIGYDRLVVSVSKGCINFVNIGVLHPFRMKESAQNLVGCPRIYVVGTEQKEPFRATSLFAHEVLYGRDSLLIGSSARIEDVSSAFLRPRTAPGRTKGR